MLSGDLLDKVSKYCIISNTDITKRIGVSKVSAILYVEDYAGNIFMLS